MLLTKITENIVGVLKNISDVICFKRKKKSQPISFLNLALVLHFLLPKWQLGFKTPSTVYLINYKVNLHNFYSYISLRDGFNRKIYEK